MALYESGKHDFNILPDNYIYISHLDADPDDDTNPPRFWRLPMYPENISDSMASTFRETNALGRSAPVMTYSNSGPRTAQFDLLFHRDIMDETNYDFSNAKLEDGDDYVDSLMKALQSIAVPRYNLNNKFVEPPLVAIRLGEELFIKGVVTGAIGLTYEKPILSNNKYARIRLSLQITEVDPYDATTVYKNGSFRGVVQTLRRGMGFED